MQFLGGCALLLPLLASVAQGFSLRSAEATLNLESAATFARVEAEDRRFWNGQCDVLESELQRLLSAAANATGVNATTLASAKANATARANATAAPAAPAKHHHASPLAGLKLNLNPKSVTDLIPALAMLKSLYEEGRKNIAQLNEREKQSKKFIEEHEAQHKKKLQQIESKFKAGKLSLEFRTNETRDEDRSWTYWSHVRERQHRQFHTSLKIQHATMQKEKNMIDMYEKTIAGTADKQEVVQELSKVAGPAMPEVVLLQQANTDLADFCVSAIAEVREARSELQQPIASLVAPVVE